MRAVLLLTVLTAAVMAAGCGSGDESGRGLSSAAESAVSEGSADCAAAIAELRDELTAADSQNLTGSALLGEDIFNSSCLRLYRFGYDELEQGMILFNEEGRLADEISIIRRRDGDTAKAEQALRERKMQRYSDFDGYVPEELPKIESGRVFTVNGCCVLMISDNADRLEKLIRDKLS